MPDDLIDHANDPLDLTGYDRQEIEEAFAAEEAAPCRCGGGGCWNCR